MEEIIVLFFELLITLSEDQVLSDGGEVHKGVLADFVAVPYHLDDVLYLLVTDDGEELVLIYYV